MASQKSLVNFMRNLPKACFAPQSFEIMRRLLGDSMGSMHAMQQQQQQQNSAGSSSSSSIMPSATVGGGPEATAAVDAWNSIGDSTDFLRHLPVGYSLGTALSYLEAALQRVKREVSTDWQVCVEQ